MFVCVSRVLLVQCSIDGNSMGRTNVSQKSLNRLISGIFEILVQH